MNNKAFAVCVLTLLCNAVFGASTTFSGLNFSDPLPTPAQLGAPSQSAGNILAQASFENFVDTAPGVVGKAWNEADNPVETTPLFTPVTLTGLPAISLEFWLNVKTGATYPNQPQGTIFRAPGVHVYIFNNVINYYFHQAQQNVWHGAIIRNDVAIPFDSQWHHYVLTFDCQYVAAYVDGQCLYRDWQGNNASQIGPMEDGTNVPVFTNIEIGGISTDPVRRLMLDEVRFSNIALTPWQVRQNFDNYRNFTKVVYASPSGSDAAAGTVVAPTSLKTAASLAGANTKIILQPGLYDAANFKLAAGAVAPLNGCLMMGQPGSSQAIIQSSTGAIASITGASYTTLRNLTFSAPNSVSLSIQNSTGCLVDACRFSGGLQLVNSPSAIVQNCISAVNTGVTAIAVGTSTNAVVRNNTVVGGAVGVAFTGSANPSYLNNILSSQTSACVTLDAASLTGVVADGNVFDPAAGANAATLGGTAYTRTQLDAYRKSLYSLDFPTDYSAKLTAYGPENFSLAAVTTFVNAANGDYRLSMMSGNPIDAGVTATNMQQIDPAVYDINGAVRPVGSQIDSGAFETSSPAKVALAIPGGSTTSAGVYNSAGALVRTLWSGQKLQSGSVSWNGLDDKHNVVPNGTYTVKAIAHNVNYSWDGVIGNSSTDLSGPYVHNAFFPMQSMAITGSTAYYVSGYNEGQIPMFAFNTAAPQKLTTKLGAPVITRAFNFVATDGTVVYFADNSSLPTTSGLIVGYTVGNNQPFQFTNGVASDSGFNGVYAGTKPGIIGMAVDTASNRLFVAHNADNNIYVLDKKSGSITSTISMSTLGCTNLGRIALDASGNLWVICTYSSATTLVHLTGFTGTVSIDKTIIVANAAALAVSPADASIVVAIGGNTHQIKAFNTSGTVLWTYGQLGGYANGPAVTNDKFFFSQPFIAMQSNGSFWIKDEATTRVMNFDKNRNFIDAIQYRPHSYVQSTNPNDPTRVFSNWLEYKIDYSKPLTVNQGWTLVNYWGYGLDTGDGFEGVQSSATLANGHTYGIINHNNNTEDIVELTATGIRFTGLSSNLSAGGLANFDFAYEGDGNLTRSTLASGKVSFSKRALTGFDASFNPTWGSEVVLATAPNPWNYPTGTVGDRWNGDDPVSNYGGPMRSNGNIIISFNPDRQSAGWHLGGILPGASAFLWKASLAGPMNGFGAFETNAEYAAGLHMINGHNIFFNLHGEAWHGGESNQFFQYYDDGLFVGQFGQPNVFGINFDALQSRVPGEAGNSFKPSIVSVNGNFYLYHNDESGHGGVHRWLVTGSSGIQELSGTVTLPILPGNPAISGGITANPNPATVNQAVTLSVSVASTQGLSIVWNFGDGTTDSTNSFVVNHTYTVASTYTVTATVTNLDGISQNTTMSLTVNPAAGQTSTVTAVTLGTVTLSGSTVSFPINATVTGNPTIYYQIARNFNGGAYTVLSGWNWVAGAASISFSDATATASGVYTYQVQAAPTATGPSTASVLTSNITVAPTVTAVNVGAITVSGSTVSFPVTATTNGGSVYYYIARNFNGGAYTVLSGWNWVAGAASLSFSDATAAASGVYTYQVQAAPTAGPSTASALTSNITITIAVAPAVTAVTTGKVTASSTKISFPITATVSGATTAYYRVSRNVNGGAYSVLSAWNWVSKSTSFTFSDTTATANGTYCYKVEASSTAGGPYQAYVFTKNIAIGPAVTGVTVGRATASKSTVSFPVSVTVSGTVNVYYYVAKSINGAPYTVVNGWNWKAGTGTSISFSDTTATVNGTYMYQVEASNSPTGPYTAYAFKTVTVSGN